MLALACHFYRHYLPKNFILKDLIQSNNNIFCTHLTHFTNKLQFMQFSLLPNVERHNCFNVWASHLRILHNIMICSVPTSRS